MHKDIRKISLSEFSHLLRENIAVGLCLNPIIERIKSVEIDFDFFFNNDHSEKQREILRELVLLNTHHWDINPIAYNKLKLVLSESIAALKLSETVTQEFLAYEPKGLVWNQETINAFDAFMNDNRMGVWAAYNMLTSRKRAIFNEAKIDFELDDNLIEITTLAEFEENILKTVRINNELKGLLEKERLMPT
ncbi:hypothetical protein [Aureibaculum marinum]|uniref:hypothetical protein n=1 Tax=Aureibaculum marinum TaxID=2487930 RepID=UPI000F4DBEF4|nr:hypothetical protein [Aureibaculum marinum]